MTPRERYLAALERMAVLGDNAGQRLRAMREMVNLEQAVLRARDNEAKRVEVAERRVAERDERYARQDERQAFQRELALRAQERAEANQARANERMRRQASAREEASRERARRETQRRHEREHHTSAKHAAQLGKVAGSLIGLAIGALAPFVAFALLLRIIL